MLHWTQNIQIGAGQVTPDEDREAAVAEFIRTRGVTRCPTACVLPTQGMVAAADQAALKEHAIERDRVRRARIAARYRSIWGVDLPVSDEE
jgi:hypothetical protein